MSGDHDPQHQNPEGDISDVLRAAEEAVDKVRGGRDDDGGDGEDHEQEGPDLEAQLEAAQAESAAARDKWLRAVADLDNYKKRVKRDIDDAIHRAVQNLLSSFLPVGDNLERALSVAPPDTNDQLLKGLDMVRQEFFSALGKHGIKPIESVGAPFDPNLHDALQQMDSPDYPPGTVVIEYEKGYRRGDKLLRPARVIVAGPGSTGQAAQVDQVDDGSVEAGEDPAN
jgi:molecular chaperone GrpE